MPGAGEAVGIRAVTAADHDAVAELNRAAFGGEEEVGIIQRLRRDGLVAVELAAVQAGAIVGHILLSVLPTTMDGRPIRALALAPMAVLPGRQGRGIGGRLIETALDEGAASASRR